MPPSQLPGERHRQPKAVERPAPCAHEGVLHQLSDAHDRVRGDLLPVLPEHDLPAGEELVQRHPDGLMELVAPALPLHVEPGRVAFEWIPGPVLPKLRNGTRVSVPAAWDTVGLAVENLWAALHPKAQQRPGPAFDHIRLQRLDQLPALLARPPRRVHDLVPVRVTPHRVRAPHDQPTLQQLPHPAIHRRLPQPGARGEHAHRERHAFNSIPLVRPEHRSEQLVEHGPRARLQPRPRHGPQQDARQPREVGAAARSWTPDRGLNRSHGAARREASAPPNRCRPRAADVPRPRADTRSHQQSSKGHGWRIVRFPIGRTPQLCGFSESMDTASTPAASTISSKSVQVNDVLADTQFTRDTARTHGILTRRPGHPGVAAVVVGAQGDVPEGAARGWRRACPPARGEPAPA